MTAEKKDVLVQGSEGKTPADMIRLAVETGADLDKLEKLLAIQQKWEADEARKAYNRAMTAFKANAPKIIKDKSVSFGQGKAAYKHASLFQVAEKIATEMSKHGLSASWRVAQNGTIAVTTRVAHIMGHFEETTLSAPSDNSGSKNPIQAIGSTISYLERYGLLAICGLASADMDDDGNSVVAEFISKDELNTLLDHIADKEVNLPKFLEYMKLESLEQMPKAKYQQALSAVQNKKKPGAR